MPSTVTRKIAHRIVPRLRIATQRLRLLPDFIIIGGMKCGSTALYEYLVRHPHVRPSARKEVHYFDASYEKGIRWYRSFFPLAALNRGHITGEATPSYLFHPAVPSRIARDVPRARLIAVLRNPVDRAFSHYQHAKRKGFEDLDFAEAISCESERLGDAETRLAEEPNLRFPSYLAHSYRERGLYGKQLERYFGLFPRAQILVVQSESLMSNPQSELDRIFAFLDLPPATLPDVRPVNRGGYERSRTRTHEELAEFFHPHNERLFSLIGKRFDWND